MKLTYSVWKLLPADVQTSFVKVGTAADDASEFDNGEENAAGLKSALTKEKEESAKVKAKLDAADAVKLQEIEAARKKAVEEARSTGDFAAVEADYKRRIKDLEDGQKKAAKETEDRTKADALNAAAEDVAKMFTVPKAMKAFVSGRLSVDLVDGKPIIRVKDKDGNASGLSLDDLKKEYLTDKELKPSIAASKGTGGGSGVPTVSGGAGTETDAKFDAASAAPKDMIARLESKGFGSEGDDD
jgi:hypothetical protein